MKLSPTVPKHLRIHLNHARSSLPEIFNEKIRTPLVENESPSETKCGLSKLLYFVCLLLVHQNVFETLAIDVFWNSGTSQIQKRWQLYASRFSNYSVLFSITGYQINVQCNHIRRGVLGDAWTANDERNANVLVIRLTLFTLSNTP